MSGSDCPGSSHPLEERAASQLVLVVEPDDTAASRVRVALTDRAEDATVEAVETVAGAREYLASQPADCVVSAQTLPDGTGLQLLDAVRRTRPDLPFVLHPAEGDEALASDAISAGVTEYVSKDRPGAVERLADSVAALIERPGGPRQDEATGPGRETRAEAADHALFLLDPDGRIVSWDGSARELLGQLQEEVVGAHLSTLYPASAVERDRPADLLAAARERGRVTDEGWLTRGDGERFWTSTVVTTLQDGDGTTGGVVAGEDGPVASFAVYVRDLTEQRERERELREQHHLTERILDTVPVAVAVHSPDGDLLRANARAREVLDILGTRDLAGTVETTVYDVDGEPLPMDAFPTRRALEGGESVADEEVALEGADGSLLWLSVSAIPMYDRAGRLERVITAARDVTAFKQREQELERTRAELETTVDELEATNRQLQRTENRFEALTENSPVAVVSIDEGSTIQFANDTVEEVFGYEPGALVGSSLTRLIPDRLIHSHQEAFGRYLREGARTLDWEWVELPGKHRDGHEVPLGISFGETTVDGEHLFTGVIRDITEEKRRQRELEQRRRELQELVAELERSNAELEQFAYVVSHDMKEPLRMISSYLELLERRYGGELGDDADEFIEFAVDGAERMQRMIDEILEYSRVGLDEATHESVDCESVVDEVVDLLHLGRTDAELDVDPLPTVRGNRTQLVKLFQNLIDNAVSHGGGDVTVRIAATREGDRWRFTVADDGPGISPEGQERVFDLFTSIGENGGSGVGLAICRKVVTHHGGEITVDSPPGEGTTFTFTLPADEASVSADASHDPSSAE